MLVYIACNRLVSHMVFQDCLVPLHLDLVHSYSLMKNVLPSLFLVGPLNQQLWKDVGHTSFTLHELLDKR